MPPVASPATPPPTSPAGRPPAARRSRRSDTIRSLLIGALFGALAAAVAIWVKRSVGAPSDVAARIELDPLQKALLVAGAVLVLFLAIALHEAGHLLGGRLVGFRSLLYVVGPLRMEHGAAGWRARLNRDAMLWGGIVASVPEDDRDLRRRMMTLVAGGPAMSLVGGVLAGLLLVAVESRWSPGSGVPDGVGSHLAATWLGLFAAASLGIGLVTLVPGRAGGFETDGAQLFKLMRGGPAAERSLAVLAIVGMSMGGRRPREWPASLVRRAAAPAAGDGAAEGPSVLVGMMLAYAYAMDTSDDAAARAQLATVLAGLEELPAGMRPSLHREAAYQAALAGDAAGARRHLEAARATPGLTTAAQGTPLAEAAVAWAEGDRDAATALLARARELLPRALDRGGALLDADRIEALAARLEREPTSV